MGKDQRDGRRRNGARIRETLANMALAAGLMMTGAAGGGLATVYVISQVDIPQSSPFYGIKQKYEGIAASIQSIQDLLDLGKGLFSGTWPGSGPVLGGEGVAQVAYSFITSTLSLDQVYVMQATTPGTMMLEGEVYHSQGANMILPMEATSLEGSLADLFRQKQVITLKNYGDKPLEFVLFNPGYQSTDQAITAMILQPGEQHEFDGAPVHVDFKYDIGQLLIYPSTQLNVNYGFVFDRRADMPSFEQFMGSVTENPSRYSQVTLNEAKAGRPTENLFHEYLQHLYMNYGYQPNIMPRVNSIEQVVRTTVTMPPIHGETSHLGSNQQVVYTDETMQMLSEVPVFGWVLNSKIVGDKQGVVQVFQSVPFMMPGWVQELETTYGHKGLVPARMPMVYEDNSKITPIDMVPAFSYMWPQLSSKAQTKLYMSAIQESIAFQVPTSVDCTYGIRQAGAAGGIEKDQVDAFISQVQLSGCSFRQSFEFTYVVPEDHVEMLTQTTERFVQDMKNPAYVPASTLESELKKLEWNSIIIKVASH